MKNTNVFLNSELVPYMYNKVDVLGKKRKILRHPKQVNYRAQLCFQGPLGFAVPPSVCRT